MTLREIRKSLGLTLEQASELLGVSFLTLQKWETHKQEVGYLVRYGIAYKYKVKVEDIEWNK